MHPHTSASNPRISRLLWLAALLPALTGCGVGPVIPPSAQPGVALHGRVHGGQQPVDAAQVYLLAANTTGYAGNGIAPSAANASVSLLNGALTANSDPIGAFVVTDINGDFDISGDYTCTPGQQVYLYAGGGNPGGGTNTHIGLMAVLGNCPAAGDFSSVPFVEINEVSTIAAAYAMAGYASDATHVSTNGSTQALTGIANAFATASNLVDLGSGLALTSTPAGNGTVPTQTINTLANILAACVNTADVLGFGFLPNFPSPSCFTLVDNATTLGNTNGGGDAATDTAGAAINIAHYPGNAVSTLFALPTPQAPFAPILTAQPNDFALGIPFTGAGIDQSFTVAIDVSGNVWFTNGTGKSLSELSPLGAPLSPSNGFTGGGLDLSYGMAIDTGGNVWATNVLDNSISEFSNSGSPISPSPGFTGDGLDSPFAPAFDASGNLWVPNQIAFTVSRFSGNGTPAQGSGFTNGGIDSPAAVAIDTLGDVWTANYGNNSISELSADGTPISTSTGFTGGGLSFPYAIAIDNSGDIWVANRSYSVSSISEFSSSGSAISTAAGFTGGGLNLPTGIAIDGAGNVWTANYNALAVSEFSNAGVPISPSTGYQAGATLDFPSAIAVDSAGNVWTTGSGTFATELVGAAVPVETPTVQALQDHCIALLPCLPQI
jgi:streptogramin lyase